MSKIKNNNNKQIMKWNNEMTKYTFWLSLVAFHRSNPTDCDGIVHEFHARRSSEKRTDSNYENEWKADEKPQHFDIWMHRVVCVSRNTLHNRQLMYFFFPFRGFPHLLSPLTHCVFVCERFKTKFTTTHPYWPRNQTSPNHNNTTNQINYLINCDENMDTIRV